MYWLRSSVGSDLLSLTAFQGVQGPPPWRRLSVVLILVLGLILLSGRLPVPLRFAVSRLFSVLYL